MRFGSAKGCLRSGSAWSHRSCLAVFVARRSQLRSRALFEAVLPSGVDSFKLAGPGEDAPISRDQLMTVLGGRHDDPVRRVSMEVRKQSSPDADLSVHGNLAQSAA